MSILNNLTSDVLRRALMLEKAGKWNEAHDLVDGHPGSQAAHIHAYLHRREGDDWNAAYWYKRASQAICTESLDDEWASLWVMYGTRKDA